MSIRRYIELIDKDHESLGEIMSMLLDRIEKLEDQVREQPENGMAEDYKHKRKQAESFRKVMAGEE